MKEAKNLISYETSIGMRVISNVNLFSCCHKDDVKDLNKEQTACLYGAHSYKLFVIRDDDNREKASSC